nr:hypothetical protein [Tanacetum cinerariifolium]
MMTRSAGRETAAPRGGRTGGRTDRGGGRTRGRSDDLGNGRIDGQGGHIGGQGTEDAEVYYDTTTGVSAHYSETTIVLSAQIEVLGKQTAYTIQSVQHQLGPGHPNIVYCSDSDESDEDEPFEVLDIHKPIYSLSGNPTPTSDSVVKFLSPLPTLFGDSDSLLEETNTLLSHSDDPVPDYETSYFDIEEKSSCSTTSHSDHFVPDYEAFCFNIDHQKEKNSGSTTSHSDLSLIEYESFLFDLLIDPLPPADRSDFDHEEFADELYNNPQFSSM